jgi:imidazolonepropionase-like amidohydrolase
MPSCFRSSLAFHVLLAAGAIALGVVGCGPTPSRIDAGDPAIDAPVPDAPGLDAGVPIDAFRPDRPDSGMPVTGPTITVCPGDSLPSLPSAACEAMAGDGNVLITADVLTPGEVFRGGQVLVDTMGHIACVGCDCASAAGAAGATRISCPDGVLSPGLINGHEHLTFQGEPYARTDERYEHRHDWRRGLRGHTRIGSNMTEGEAETELAELRMVMGGATSVNGSGGRAGFVRNVDRSGIHEAGLAQPQVEYQTFPLDDSDGTMLATGCAYGSGRDTATTATGSDAYTPHVAEAIDREGRNEYLCMREGMNDLIQDQTALIHGVALLPVDMEEIANDGAMLIWSPRTNITLYGDTARVTEYDRMGVSIALGTDWVSTGSMNMLRELQCADELNATYFAGHFTDEELWMMATRNGAIAMAMDDAIGTIATGLVADLAIFDARVNVDHRAVIDAQAADVVLVMRAGLPLYGDASLMDVIPGGGSGCDMVDVCGTPKRACVMREAGVTYDALVAGANMGRLAHPPFVCGEPLNEPSCRPERNAATASIMGSTRYTGLVSAADTDGDGIEAGDNCPSVFNPIRPLDMGMQADSDMDGEGDACDPCPLDADTTTCTMVDPLDRDRDGVREPADNCPSVANADQADRDMDMKGDACDPCPDTPNPGTATCPISVYSIKRGIIPDAAMATDLRGVITAITPNGFFLQVTSTDPGYEGADYSGIFVFTSTMPAGRTRGEAVSVSGEVNLFSGQWQLQMTTVTSMGMGTIPAPVVVPAAEIATGGARAEALEGVLVRVEGVSVTNANPDAPMDFGELAVTGNLRVDDWMTMIAPFRTVGTTFTSITGPLAFRFANTKINPRDAADIVSP